MTDTTSNEPNPYGTYIDDGKPLYILVDDQGQHVSYYLDSDRAVKACQADPRAISIQESTVY